MLELTTMHTPASRGGLRPRRPPAQRAPRHGGHHHGATPSHARGFTLIELILTVVILVIVLALGVPAFTETIRQNRITTQANDLHTLLLLARVEAIKRGVDVDVELSRLPGTDSWTAQVVDPADPSLALRRAENETAPVSLNATWSAIDDTWSVTFNPLGQRIAPVGADEMRLSLQHHGCARGQRRELMIERSGRIFVDAAPASRICQAGGDDA